MTARAPLVVLVALAAMGLVLKAGRLWGIAEGAGAWDLLWLLPASVGRDLATAGAVGLVVYALAKKSARAAAVVGALVSLVLLFFAMANAISYGVTQAPITLQRLRGDEGVKLGDIALLDVGDWLPGVIVVCATLAVAVTAAWRARTMHKATTWRALVLVLLLAALSEGAHRISGNRLLLPPPGQHTLRASFDPRLGATRGVRSQPLAFTTAALSPLRITGGSASPINPLAIC